MPWIMTTTASSKIEAYSFDVMSKSPQKKLKLVVLQSVIEAPKSSFILTSKLLNELKLNNVAVFDSKKEARIEYNKLNIGTCRYIELKLDFTKEFLSNHVWYGSKSNGSWVQYIPM